MKNFHRVELSSISMYTQIKKSLHAPILGGSYQPQQQLLDEITEGKPLDVEYPYFRGDAFQYRLQIEQSAALPARPVRKI